MKRLLVFNSGSGSGFQKLVEYGRSEYADYKVVGLVVDREDRFAIQRAERINVPYTVLESYTDKDYLETVKLFGADFVALSGWLKLVKGLDPRTTINIHPGPLPKFGGPGMYGHHVHEAMIVAYKKGEVTHSAVCMHFVTKKYDKGPIFIQFPVKILPSYDVHTLGSAVNTIEHGIQAFITNLVVTGQIHWDGKNPESLVLPDIIKTITTLAV